MDRRSFNKMCSGLLAGAANMSLAARNSYAANQPAFPRTALLDPDGNPLQPSALATGTAYIFNYPFVTTPCFIIRLRSEQGTAGESGPTTLLDKAGTEYQWQGGVGDDNSIVAFSAICTHKMSHPAKPVSHLNFRNEEKIFFDRDGKKQQQSQLIYCCSEHSVYDPSAGAKVLSGPATQPLAAIELELNDKDELIAVNSYGGNMYDDFLQKFGFRQAMEQNVSDPATPSGDHARITAAEDYSTLQILC